MISRWFSSRSWLGNVDDAVDRQPEDGLLAVQVRNLELADGSAEHERDAVVVVEDVFEIAEAVILRGVIVDRIRAAVGRLDAQVVAQKVAGDEVAEGSRAAAVVEARLNRAVAAAVHGDRAARGLQPALGRDVDDARGAQAVFGRQARR